MIGRILDALNTIVEVGCLLGAGFLIWWIVAIAVSV